MPRLRFDFAGQNPVVFIDPRAVIAAHHVQDVLPAFRIAEQALADGRYVAGFVSYEAAPAFDTALTTKAPTADLPLVWFGVFDEISAAEPIDGPGETDGSDVAWPATWTPDISHAEYTAAVGAVRDAIAAGDTYQANYTFRLHAPVQVRHAAALYRRLIRDQRPRYAAHLDLGRWHIVSLSPELFFRIDGGRLTTRPMKGTSPRGTTAENDADRAEWLRRSEKNRAENVMIVDLARNDVGRVSSVGSVRATRLFEIERYPSVLQLVSTVEGQLRGGTTLTDVFAALFPAGSVTGAPKSSSMKLIASLERAARGVYCGAVGFAAPTGDAVFNVAIRTATVDAATGLARFGTGGGITWDSRAGDEYEEALSKTACLAPIPAFDLFETMRLEDGVCVRLHRHLDRLARSAAYFDRPFSIAAAQAAVENHAGAHPCGVRRVRLRTDASGAAVVTSEPFEAAADGPLRVVLASSPVTRTDLWLHHKTTRRTTYDAHRAEHPDAFDVLLWNEEGELTEFTIGNLAVELEGRRWTPPIRCGLLPGVFRAAQLEAGVLRERELTRGDLVRASRVWLINSLREWVEVEITPGATSDARGAT